MLLCVCVCKLRRYTTVLPFLRIPSFFFLFSSFLVFIFHFSFLSLGLFFSFLFFAFAYTSHRCSCFVHSEQLSMIAVCACYINTYMHASYQIGAHLVDVLMSIYWLLLLLLLPFFLFFFLYSASLCSIIPLVYATATATV